MQELLKIWNDLMTNKNEERVAKSIAMFEASPREVWQEKMIKSKSEGERSYAFLKKIQKKIAQENENIGYKKHIEALLKWIREIQGKEIIFMFSGNTFIQQVKGNRCIRLTQEFARQEVPVIYAYWSWNKTDVNRGMYGEYIYQLPINEVLFFMETIIKEVALVDKKKIFILSFPYPLVSKYIEILKYYQWTVIYDIRDDWEEFEKVGQAKWYQKPHEIYAIEKSDKVMAVSNTLAVKFKAYTKKNIELVPNALDLTFGVQTFQKESGHIGYVGHLTDAWFDWSSLFEIATQLPEYSFEIIGHTLPESIQKLPNNITYLGAKTFDEIKEIATGWKVGIIPFKINTLTQAVDPIKVYEYLAMGLKVVSFDMPQIRTYPEVKIAYNVEEFAQLIKEADKEVFDEESVKVFLMNNTWGNRVKLIREWGIK